MRSDRSGSVCRLAGCNYGDNGGPSVKLNYGSPGSHTDYLQTWLQGADTRADARAALQFEKYVLLRALLWGKWGLFEPQGIQELKSSAVWCDRVVRGES